MEARLAAVIMAAGKSTRMKSALPKAAHAICGKAMTRHVIDACRDAGIGEIVVVVGHEAERVRAALGDDVSYAYQTQQLGTGHACLQAMPSVPEDVSEVVVLPGDTPLITSEAISAMIERHFAEANAATLLTAELDDASHYGRVIRDEEGAVIKIMEARDADEDVLAIREINTSIYCFNKSLLLENLAKLKTDNAQGEYYLTDIVELLNLAKHRVGAEVANEANDTLGINNRIELAEAARIMRRRILDRLMLAGVTVMDPATTYIDCDVEVGHDTVIHPCTIIERGNIIGRDCEIGPFAHLRAIAMPDSTKGDLGNG